MDIDGDFDEDLFCVTPPDEVLEAVNEATLSLLPTKSREKYENAYQRFMEYRSSKEQSKVFTNEQIGEFMINAPNDTYLMAKVVVIFGIYGPCRREELCNLKLADIEDLGSQLLVKIPCNTANKPRSFIVNGTYLGAYRKYATVRPSNFECNRFFFKYHNGKRFKQVGVHHLQNKNCSINYEVESTGLSNLIGNCNNCTINVHINRK
ncbi:uncharacterized protein LOC116167789 [Photinus pyralis]|nr:uncharacterized protein LOC116163024 [Photinus pyralis]XP_031332706.1 uncharacterized protein LOC116163024 [Photinus pyralis]XP_031332707.1 uncharacterized protein LOC116163024 [Photinus pyralis]XP_031339173.1 uncharacterized protein LOC116167789 [Photinus pyralis]